MTIVLVPVTSARMVSFGILHFLNLVATTGLTIIPAFTVYTGNRLHVEHISPTMFSILYPSFRRSSMSPNICREALLISCRAKSLPLGLLGFAMAASLDTSTPSRSSIQKGCCSSTVHPVLTPTKDSRHSTLSENVVGNMVTFFQLVQKRFCFPDPLTV